MKDLNMANHQSISR